MNLVNVPCPHCDGDGEEPGAPMELDGVWVCGVCGGDGEVSEDVANAYNISCIL